MIPVVDALAATSGRDCEVVLDDVPDWTSSVIAIANGHVTNRGVGSPATDFLDSMETVETGTQVATEPATEPGVRLNYHSHTDAGRLLKCTTISVRDGGGEILGALCINDDITRVQVATSVLEDLSHVAATDAAETKVGTEEAFPRDASSSLQIMSDQALSRQSKLIAFITKKDKIKVFSDLDGNGIFSIKHAVETVARPPNMSRYTNYNHMDEVRSERRMEAVRARGTPRPSGARGTPAPADNRRRPADATAYANTTGTED
jgi:predicted transcriptional regulator YheO